MSVLPQLAMVGGSGRPRVMVIYSTPIYQSAGNETYTFNSVAESGAPVLSAIRANMRIESMFVSGTQQVPCYAKVLSVDDATDIITVDAWYPQIPTNNQPFTVNGRIVDLPYCRTLGEIREPSQLIHELWDYSLETEWQGWKYTCVLDYSQHMWGDQLQIMGPILNLNRFDRLVLIPRVDAPEWNYNVIFSPNTPITLRRMGLDLGYKDGVFIFVGKELVASWPIQSGYGTGYAENYGVQL